MKQQRPLFCRVLAAFLALCLVFTAFGVGVVWAEEDVQETVPGTVVTEPEDTVETEETDDAVTPSYSEYLTGVVTPIDKTVSIDITQFTNQDNNEDPRLFTDYEGRTGSALLLPKKGSVSFAFSVEAAGYYNLSVLYYPYAGSGSTILRDVLIDGVLPFEEAAGVSFERIWADDQDVIYDENGKPTKVDANGNQVRPQQVEAPAWTEKTVIAYDGSYNRPFYFYLTAGEHTLTFVGRREPLMVGEIVFEQKVQPKPYAEVLAQYNALGYKPATGNIIRVEAELANAKSDQTMYALADRTSPTTWPQPDNPGLVYYNTIGGTQWQSNGQWLEWEIAVTESGLYNLGAHFRQSEKSNDISIRELYIDGELPFAEADSIAFGYDSAWQSQLIGYEDENGKPVPYQFYFEAGRTYSLRLRVGMGVYTQTVEKVQTYLMELNRIYRCIVVVTGASPDLYRDYKFDIVCRQELLDMAAIRTKLQALREELKVLTDGGGANLVSIDKLITDLTEMIDDEEQIAYRLATFKDDIASFGTWMNSLKQMPLALDQLYIAPVATEEKLPEGEANFFRMLGFYFAQFFASFTSDYQAIGVMDTTGTTASVTVWVTTGRDQAQILKQLVNDDFTPNQNIAVNLQLVAGGSLLPAVLAGIGPDISLGIAQAEPMNMALRGAVADLSTFSDWKDVAGRFHENALVPFTFTKWVTEKDDNGNVTYEGYKTGVYAVPETESYPVLFYRKDILQEMNITTSDLDTWESILQKVLPVLQKSSLMFGMGPSVTNYVMLLYQNGGTMYSDDFKNCLFDTPEAITTMRDYIMLYDQYGMPLAYDFSNRFRTGEMPIAIADFTVYNQLTVFAPEIKGLWGMLPMPGTMQADGTIDRSCLAGVTGSIMLQSAKTKPDGGQAAWEFLKWWVSADVQTSYGKNLESVVGSAARYNSANVEAMANVEWDYDIAETLEAQLAWTKPYYEVPGGYFTGRHYEFAFRDILYNAADIRETLSDAVDQIDREIANKRDEYHLDGPAQ